jgi:hypothetical protein
VYAGELALRDMGAERVAQYKVLMRAFPASPAAIVKVGDQLSDQNPVHVAFQSQFKQVFAIFKGLGWASQRPLHHRPQGAKAEQRQQQRPELQLKKKGRALVERGLLDHFRYFASQPWTSL